MNFSLTLHTAVVLLANHVISSWLLVEYYTFAIHPSFLFLSGGLLMVDVRDPLNPVFAGCYQDDGYTHDAQCVIYRGPDTDHFEKEVKKYTVEKFTL